MLIVINGAALLVKEDGEVLQLTSVPSVGTVVGQEEIIIEKHYK